MSVRLDLVLKGRPELLILQVMTLLLQELYDDSKIDLIAHLLHEVLIPDLQEPLEVHALNIGIEPLLELLVDFLLHLEDLLD